MKHAVLLVVMVGVVVLTLGASAASAEEGVIAGVDLGFAQPISKLKDRVSTGGVFSPFAGYMFNDYVGLMGQLQIDGFPFKNRPGITDEDIWALGAHAGPRLAVPFHLGSLRTEVYATGQAGLFTGLNSNTPVSRTSWGYSTGGGLNLRLNNNWLLGVFGRYNYLDQRVIPDAPVEFATAGFSLTYNMAAPPPAPPRVAEAPPPPPPPPPAKKKIVLRGVNFDFDKSNIRADARPILDEAIATLKQEGGIAVIAEGHTDSRGTDAYNQKLSERRANSVRDYLVKGGIAADRIRSEGFGESRPVASNDTDDGRAQNRRVELRIQGD